MMLRSKQISIQQKDKLKKMKKLKKMMFKTLMKLNNKTTTKLWGNNNKMK